MAESSNREKDIFLQALDLTSSAARDAFLAQACGSDEALRGHIEALVRAHATPDSFLEKPAAALGITVDALEETPSSDRNPTEGPGTRIGPYKLLEAIGEGGMGVVFMAEQQEPVRRTVALKIIKPGMDSGQVLARFEAERQALALMDHPNIARVLDAGATGDGRPFFVMELVKGTPITTFCDTNKLPARQRLELFVPVCQAIQHAHQKGVIHRDIKPSNVLIALYDDRPVPKVIDFGIAKAAGNLLSERTLHTGFGAIVGTPEYMSPEQATFNQLDIDTRSDVYSLGVLLYELLTGTTPVDKIRLKQAAILEVLRVVREEEPPRPSVKLSTTHARASIAATRGTDPDKLAQQLRGELDWIVMKALEKERNRRYETAAGLARDVDRYLKDELVEARPPSTRYRLRKFVNRHRGKVAAVSLLLLTLLAGVIGTTWGLFEARRQRDAAEQARLEETSQRQRAQNNEALAVAAEGQATKSLTRNEGLRLVLQSELTRSTNPGLALLLAIEGTERHPGLLANNALLAALDANPEERTLLGHEDPVPGLYFSADGRRLLTASLDGTARLWDLETGKQLVVFKEDNLRECAAVCFHPDGKRVLTTSPFGRARLWDAATGKALFLLEDPEDRVGRQSPDFNPISPAQFSPDGRLILTGYGKARLWDAATGKQHRVFEGHAGRVNWAEFGHDGKRIITAGADRTARIWDAESGQQLQVLKGASNKEFVPPMREVVLARLSPDGLRALTVASTGGAVSSKDPLCRLWDIRTGKELASLGHPMGTVFAPLALFSPDGSRVLTANYWDAEPSLNLWDAATGKPLASAGWKQQNTVAAFSPDGQRLAASPMGKTIEVLNTTTLATIDTLRGSQGAIQAVAFSPDGQRLAAADGYGVVRIWVVAGDAERRLGRWSQYKVLAVSSDGHRLAARTPDPRELAVWDTTTGKEITRLKGRGPPEVDFARFSPDGRKVLFGWRAHWQESVLVGDVERGQVTAVLPGGEHALYDAAISPDGRRAVTTDDMRKGRLWDLVADKELASWSLAESDRNLGGLRFSPDGRWLLTCQVTGARLRDAATGKEVAVLRPENTGLSFVAGPALFSPDGRRVLTRYIRGLPTMAHVWDTATHKVVAVLNGNAAAFSSDGDWIVNCGHDNTARIWETATGKERRVLKGFSGVVTSASVSPDNTRIVTLAGRTAQLWNVRTGELEAVYHGHQEVVESAQFIPGGRVLSVDRNGAARVWPVEPLPTARARAPRELTPEERKQYEVPATGQR